MFTKNLDDMIYSSWDTVCQVEIGKYGSFFAHLPASKNQKKKKKKKIEFLKNGKNCWRYNFTHVYQKLQSCEVWFLRSGMRQT